MQFICWFWVDCTERQRNDHSVGQFRGSYPYPPAGESEGPKSAQNSRQRCAGCCFPPAFHFLQLQSHCPFSSIYMIAMDLSGRPPPPATIKPCTGSCLPFPLSLNDGIQPKPLCAPASPVFFLLRKFLTRRGWTKWKVQKRRWIKWIGMRWMGWWFGWIFLGFYGKTAQLRGSGQNKWLKSMDDY